MAGGSTQSNNGLGCGTVLFFIFITLKLTHYVDWSWWWVTAPLWIGPALIILLIAIIAIAGD